MKLKIFTRKTNVLPFFCYKSVCIGNTKVFSLIFRETFTQHVLYTLVADDRDETKTRTKNKRYSWGGFGSLSRGGTIFFGILIHSSYKTISQQVENINEQHIFLVYSIIHRKY